MLTVQCTFCGSTKQYLYITFCGSIKQYLYITCISLCLHSQTHTLHTYLKSCLHQSGCICLQLWISFYVTSFHKFWIFLKVALLLPINWFSPKNIWRNYHAYIIINAFIEGICVEFKRKNNTTTLVFLLSNCSQVLNICYDWLIKYYFWRFRYRITRLFRKYCLAMKYR